MHTTKDFVELLRAQITAELKLPEPASYYRVAKDLETSETTVSRWKDGKGGMSPALAMKVASRLGIPHAYALACIHAERERAGEVLPVWQSIAKHFGKGVARHAGKPLSILVLAALGAGGMQGAPASGTAEFLAHSPPEGARAGMYIMLSRRRRLLRGLGRRLRNAVTPPPLLIAQSA